MIHSHHVYPDGYGLIKTKKHLKIPLVVDIHGDDFFYKYYNNVIYHKLFSKVLLESDKIICISENLYNLALNNKIEQNKLEYIPLGINTDIFYNKYKNNINNKINILFVGQLIPRKNVFKIMEIARYLKNNRKDIIDKIHFFIVGDGPQKNIILHYISNNNLDSIITVHENVDQDKLVELYSISKIFILPSLSEGKPIVINEAMATECAIIAPNISGIKEQIINGYNGFLIDNQNLDSYLEKIIYLIENEDELEKMCNNSRKKIFKDNITWDNYSKNIVNLYKNI